jgi:hypothetical protein
MRSSRIFSIGCGARISAVDVMAWLRGVETYVTS